MPDVSDDGTYVVGYARAFDNKDRWLVLTRPRDRGVARRGPPARRRLDPRGARRLRRQRRRVPARRPAHLVHLGEGRLGAPLHRGRLGGLAAGGAADEGPVGGHERRRSRRTAGTSCSSRPRWTPASGTSTRWRSTAARARGSPRSPARTTPRWRPTARCYGDVYSYSNKPPELYLVAAQPGAPMRQLTTTPTAEWRSFKWADPQVLTFEARDGAKVHARLYTPEMIGAKRDRTHPGVVFVHGAGYLQNAHKYWSSYYREYMFHNLLAARGYVVLDVDYRGERGLRPRLAHGHLPPHGRPGPRRHRGRREVPGDRAEGRRRSASASTAAATAASSR